LLIHPIPKMLLYRHLNPLGERIPLKGRIHWYTENQVKIMANGKSFQMVFQSPAAQLFQCLRRIQMLQKSSMLSTTVDYFSPIIQASHGVCSIFRGPKNISPNILGRYQ
jgi:hypothetical protein